MDHLDALFSYFSPTASVFFSGNLCQNASFDDSGSSVLHILKAGTLNVSFDGKGVQTFEQPTLMFYPAPLPHRFMPKDDAGVDLICASINFGDNTSNPLVKALPGFIHIPLDDLPELAPALDLLFTEGFNTGCGRQSALDRLTEYLMILILRHTIANADLRAGILAGMSEPRLAKAILAIHRHPELPWTLDSLAEEAGMSRARLAHHFREKTGFTVMEYVQDWRMAIARVMLEKGRSVKSVAASVGYKSPAALTRVFSGKTGIAPSNWAHTVRQSKSPPV